MAKRRKTSRKKALRPAASSSLYQVAERAVLKQSNKVLDAATKRYKRFVRQAAKATNNANRRKYLAAALSAVAIAGVVANDLKRRIDKQPVATARRARA
jgi:hypothetical protein